MGQVRTRYTNLFCHVCNRNFFLIILSDFLHCLKSIFCSTRLHLCTNFHFHFRTANALVCTRNSSHFLNKPSIAHFYEKFFKKCGELGIDGIISPDLPYEEKGEIKDIALSNDVDVISLIAPTSKERIQKIASDATGFIYVVSSLGVTGMRSEIKTDLKSILDDIRAVSDLPLAVGFGINTPEQASNIGKIADGVIVGSAIVKIIEEHGENAVEPLKEYVSAMKTACNE